MAVVFPLAGADALEDGGLRLQGGTVDGGGRYSAGARYAVEGTIGQPEPGRAIGGRFVVNGGFWAPTGTAALPVELIFRNGFED